MCVFAKQKICNINKTDSIMYKYTKIKLYKLSIYKNIGSIQGIQSI